MFIDLGPSGNVANYFICTSQRTYIQYIALNVGVHVRQIVISIGQDVGFTDFVATTDYVIKKVNATSVFHRNM